MRKLYKKIYVIRIDHTKDNTKWYYNKSGRIYETELEHINNQPYFRIDNIHKLPSELATIIEIKRIELYQKL